MTRPLLVALAGWLLLTGAGAAVLASLPRPLRAPLLPAAPLLGVALSVVVLSLTTAVLPVRAGVLALLLAVAVLLVLAHRRDDPGTGVTRAQAAALLLVPVLAGLVPFALAAAPSVRSGGALVLPSSNHDGYYYVGVTDWVLGHPGLQQPALGGAPAPGAVTPFDASALRHVQQHLRLGESLVQAGVDALLGLDPETSWYGLTCLWLLLVPGGLVAVVRLLDLPLLLGAVGGAVVAAMPLVLRQAYNQNSASLLGIALAPLALVLAAEVLGPRRRVPVLLGATGLAAWLGTYTEYAVVAAPALLLVLLVRPPSDLGPALLRGVRLGALALLVGPVVWTNAVRSLLFLAGLPPTPWHSPFLQEPRGLVVARAVGAVPLDSTTTGRSVPLLLGLALLVGVGAAVALAEHRVLWAAVPLAVGAAVLQYSVRVPNPYTQQRVVEIGMPLVLAAAVVGWAALAAWLEPQGLLAVGLVPVVVWLGAGLRTDVHLLRAADAAPRPVDATFAEAARWVRELGGPEGRDVSVVVDDFFDQLWTVDALKHDDLVAYPRLDPSYMVREQFWGGEVDRYVLVDDAAWVDAPPAATVRANARFRLLDLQAGPVTVATTVGYSAGRWYGAEPGPSAWMADHGSLFVYRPGGTPAVDLELAANPDLRTVHVTVGGGSAPVTAAVPASGTTVRVPLPPGAPASLLALDNVEPAAPATSVGDARPLSVRLTGVRRAR